MRGRANRVGWAVVAVVLIAVGGAGLALSQGVFGARRQHTDILSSTLVRHWNQGANTSFEVAGGIAALAAVIGFVLALFQLRRPRGRTPRLGDLRFGSRHGRGTTTVRVSGLRRAVEVDLGRIPGVERAAVGLSDADPVVNVSSLLEIDGDSSLPAVAAGVRDAVGRLRDTSGRPVGDTGVLVRLRSRTTKKGRDLR